MWLRSTEHRSHGFFHHCLVSQWGSICPSYLRALQHTEATQCHVTFPSGSILPSLESRLQKRIKHLQGFHFGMAAVVGGDGNPCVKVDSDLLVQLDDLSATELRRSQHLFIEADLPWTCADWR